MTQIHTHPQAKKRNKWCFYFIFFSLKKKLQQQCILQCGELWGRDGNGARWGQRMGSSSPPRMVLSCPILTPPRPAPHNGENFLTPSLPLRALRSLAPPLKPYFFLLICPTVSTIFFNETNFINKNILKITTKFIPSNQINF